MTGQEQQTRTGSGRWAPWWVYLIVIVGANYLRQLIMPVGTIPSGRSSSSSGRSRAPSSP